jgi:hypothetical protein
VGTRVDLCRDFEWSVNACDRYMEKEGIGVRVLSRAAARPFQHATRASSLADEGVSNYVIL